VQQKERLRIAVAIARYCFYSGTAAVAPLLNLTNSGSGSNAINKVAVAHLWCWQGGIFTSGVQER